MNHEVAQIVGGSRWLAETNGIPIGMNPDARMALFARVATLSAEVEAGARAEFAAMADRPMPLTLVGDVAVITMNGPITYKGTWFSMLFGCATVEGMQQQFRSALADPAVRAIVFRCGSPGGNVVMIPEFADEIFAARGVKPMHAIADTEICSAAYWLASQCDQVYASRSSMLGCIGTYVDHVDLSAMYEKAGVKITRFAHPAEKAEGNEHEPLSEAGRAHYQEYADEVGVEFKAAVARGRNVPVATVVEWSKIGAIPPRGKRAIALGLADKPGTFAQVVGKMTKGRAVAAGDTAPALAASEVELEEVEPAAIADVHADAAPTVPEPSTVVDAQVAADRDHLNILAALSAD